MDDFMEKSLWYICVSHGPHQSVICSKCVDGLVDMLTSTVQQSFYNTEPVSFGRWETLTEYDRNFLASLGISAE
jgi:hypothetical protein